MLLWRDWMNKIILGTGLATAVALTAPVYAQGQGQGGYGQQGGYYGQGGYDQQNYTTPRNYFGASRNLPGEYSGGMVQAPGAMPNYPGPRPSGPMSGGGGGGR